MDTTGEAQRPGIPLESSQALDASFAPLIGALAIGNNSANTQEDVMSLGLHPELATCRNTVPITDEVAWQSSETEVAEAKCTELHSVDPMRSSINAIYQAFDDEDDGEVTSDSVSDPLPADLTQSVYAPRRLSDAAPEASDASETSSVEPHDEAIRQVAHAEEKSFQSESSATNEMPLRNQDSPPTASSLTESSLRALDRANSRQQDRAHETTSGINTFSRETAMQHPNLDRSPEKGKETQPSDPKSSHQLALRLQRIFALDDAEDVIAETEASLFRSVMLDGCLFLTTKHLCFYAYLRSKEGQLLRSGYLSRRSMKTRRYTRHWFILKADSLTWYSGPDNPYFANGDLSLQYVTAAQPSAKNPKALKILTASREIYLDAGSQEARDEWLKAIKKAVFRCQTESDSVKITIKLSAITSIEPTPIQFVSALCVRVEDEELDHSRADYYFAYLPSMESFCRSLRVTVAANSGMRSSAVTHANTQTSAQLKRRASIETIMQRPESESDAIKYPPDHSSDVKSSALLRDRPSSGRWQLGKLPSWMKGTPSVLTSGGWGFDRSAFRQSSRTSPSITQVLSSEDSQLADEDLAKASRSSADDFRASFGVSSDERLLLRKGYKKLHRKIQEHGLLADVYIETTAYLHRGLPVFGKVYASNLNLRFQSTTLLFRTKMTIPMADVSATIRNRSLRPGYHGLIIVVKGFEEIFVEFGSESERNSIKKLVDFQADHARRAALEGTTPMSDTILASSRNTREESESDHDPLAESTLLVDFTPSKALHFVCLTIGSRGDVQPYIALCKGLCAKGHRCTIASHPEYRKWVEAYGIQFEAVGGDPAELMRICVENGTFTLAFLKEGLTKFRGWLDALLSSAWSACQGADVLIESPSAMAGIHIAEALRIPYFRAFTMPWSRTRAYPHAFAVPESKLGGQYNQLSYIMFDSVFWRAISGQINRWRKVTLNLQPTTLEKLGQDKVPFLYNLSPSVMPRPLDWPEWIHVTGYWFLTPETPSAWSPPDDLIDFLQRARANDKKVIYIGFGSIVVSDFNHLTQIIYDAILKSDVHAIVSKGWSDRLQHSSTATRASATHGLNDAELPPRLKDVLYQVESIPHDWLFPRLDAVCHHGGSGTTGASLRAGKPTIIRPFFGDQFFQADRVESLGVGFQLREMTSDALAAAFKLGCTDERLISKAEAMGQAIQKQNGVENAIETIYRDMEYARTLMRASPSDGSPDVDKHGRQRSSSNVSGDGTENSSSWGQMSASTHFDDVLSRSGIGSTPPQSHPASRDVSRSQSRSRMSSDGD